MKCSTEQVIEFLKSHREVFAREFTVEKIGIFGSYARGDASEESDLDVIVEMKKPDLFFLIGIKQAVEEALGVRVDIVRLRENMNETLRKRIEKDVVYV
jgi:hypothetical protein